MNRKAHEFVGGMVVPRDERHKKFCDELIKTHDPRIAGRNAGFSESWISLGHYKKLIIKYDKYLAKRMDKTEKEVARVMVLDQQKILDEYMAIAFANPLDYIETEITTDGKGNEIRKHRRKDVTQLTRAQAAAISEIKFKPDGSVTYKLPDDKTKHPYLKDLGQHLGLFHQKLIAEHRHQHLHQLSFRGADPSKLEQLEQQLLDALGPDAARMLGIQIEGVEYNDITED